MVIRDFNMVYMVPSNQHDADGGGDDDDDDGGGDDGILAEKGASFSSGGIGQAAV